MFLKIDDVMVDDVLFNDICFHINESRDDQAWHMGTIINYIISPDQIIELIMAVSKTKNETSIIPPTSLPPTQILTHLCNTYIIYIHNIYLELMGLR